MRRRDLSNAGKGMSLLGKKKTQQRLDLAIFRDHDIRARFDQTFSLPGVDALAVDLVAGHGHGNPADFLDLFDLHKAVAKSQQLVATKIMLAQNALDDHLLGEVLIVIK